MIGKLLERFCISNDSKYTSSRILTGQRKNHYFTTEENNIFNSIQKERVKRSRSTNFELLIIIMEAILLILYEVLYRRQWNGRNRILSPFKMNIALLTRTTGIADKTVLVLKKVQYLARDSGDEKNRFNVYGRIRTFEIAPYCPYFI